MRTYEAIVIFRPEDELLAEGKKFLQELFKETGCKIIKEEHRGNRELAYKIKKTTRGAYLFYEIESEPESIKVLDKALKLRSEILKFLILRKEA